MGGAHKPNLVSVVIPAYNRAHCITEALESIWCQSHRPIEVILVDDGSTDETVGVVRDWERKRGIPLEKFRLTMMCLAHGGAQIARNSGVRLAQGEFVQYLDSDHVLLPDKLEHQVTLLRSEPLDYVYGEVEFRQAGKDLPVSRFGVGRRNGRPWYSAHNWETEAPLFHRRVCLAVGPWDEGLAAAQDYEYAARVKAMGFRGRFVSELVAVSWRHTGPSITGLPLSQRAAAMTQAAMRVFETLERHGKDAPIERNRIASNLVRLASQHARTGNPNEAQRILEMSCEIARGPFRLGAQALSCLSRSLTPHIAFALLRCLARPRSCSS